METQHTDTLTEACKIAGIIASEEKSIVELEKEIADRLRNITKKIFSSAHFRMPTQRLSQEDESGGVQVYSDICIVLHDGIAWINGRYYGNARTLRITPKGDIIYAWQGVYGYSQYSLAGKSNWEVCIDADGDVLRWGDASDHSIAIHAVELANKLLNALKKRIDTSKDEKDELQQIAGKPKAASPITVGS